jgi:hypothetical protein
MSGSAQRFLGIGRKPHSPVVIARLDRATPYSRASELNNECSGILGYPLSRVVTGSAQRDADGPPRLRLAPPYPITILVRGPIRANSLSKLGRVMAMQPAVGPKLSRARCRNTALPRPEMRGVVLWSISMIKS